MIQSGNQLRQIYPDNIMLIYRSPSPIEPQTNNSPPTNTNARINANISVPHVNIRNIATTTKQIISTSFIQNTSCYNYFRYCIFMDILIYKFIIDVFEDNY